VQPERRRPRARNAAHLDGSHLQKTTPGWVTFFGLGCKILNFRPLDKNTLEEVFELELSFGGLVIRGAPCMKKGTRDGSAGPGGRTRDGGKAWENIIDFADSKSKYRLQYEVLR
jgi:hypothetical protein